MQEHWSFVRLLAADRGEEPLEPLEIPNEYQEYIKSIAYFLELVPDDENRSTYDYLAADVYYRYQHWEEAENRYKNVLAAYPTEDVGNIRQTFSWISTSPISATKMLRTQ